MDAVVTSVQEIGRSSRELAQSLARPARFRYVVHVTGNGETRLIGSKAINFKTAMLEEPSFSFGLQSVTPLPLGALPLGSAIVLGYHIERNMWRGVEMGFRVDAYAKKPQIKFWLTFEAVALRSAAGLR